MKGFQVTRFSYVLIIVVATLFVGAGTVKATALLTCGSWNVVSIPNVGADDILYGAAAVPGTQQFWAVGRYDGSDGFYHTLTEHWNGSSWSAVSSPSVGNTNNVLNAVAVVSATNVWAVGLSDCCSNAAGQTLIEHWNGTSWSIVSSPSPSQEISFNAVAADSANDIWAVGDYEISSGAFLTLIEHWNGTNWSIVKSPSPDCCYNWLQGVTALSASDVWAVGSRGNGQTLVEQWNGTKWSVVPSPNAVKGQDENNYLYGVTAVSGNANDIWAVGTYYGTTNPHGYQTLVEQWNGTKWSIVKSPSPGGNGGNPELYAVTADSANDAWAVGYSIAGSSAYLTLTEHWNGSTWSVVPSPNPGGTNEGDENELYGVAALSAHDVQAVGYDRIGYFGQTTTLAESYC